MMGAKASSEWQESTTNIKIMTYNIWFDHIFRKERWAKFVELIIQHQPTIICVQEATPSFCEWMSSNEHMKQYYCSDRTGSSFSQGYGVVTYSLFPVNFSNHQLVSRMGRNLILTSFTIGEESFSFGNVHLESLSNATYRKQQLEEIHKILEDDTSAMLMGDFNFDDLRNWDNNWKEQGQTLENETLDTVYSDYKDLWLELRKNNRGITFDSTVNPVIQQFEQMRYDRMMFKSDTFEAVDIQMLGVDGFTTSNGIKFSISDHFGLICELQKKQ